MFPKDQSQRQPLNGFQKIPLGGLQWRPFMESLTKSFRRHYVKPLQVSSKTILERFLENNSFIQFVEFSPQFQSKDTVYSVRLN